MTWATIRKATENDLTILNARAAKFAERHKLSAGDDKLNFCMVDLLIMGMEDSDDDFIQVRGRRLRALLTAIVRRATGEPHATGVAYGYIGYEN